MKHVKFLAALAASATALVGVAQAEVRGNRDSGAEQYVQKALDEAFVILSDTSLSKAARDDKLAEMMTKHVNIGKAAGRALGRYARQTTAAQRKTYVCLFKPYILTFYNSQLDSYADEQLTVTSSNYLADAKIDVFAEALGAKPGSSLSGLLVMWELEKRGDQYAALDVGADQIWLSTSISDQFQSIISSEPTAQQGVDVLIDRLAEKVGAQDAAACESA